MALDRNQINQFVQLTDVDEQYIGHLMRVASSFRTSTYISSACTKFAVVHIKMSQNY